MKAPFLVGRLLFGGYFIMAGINHFKQTGQLSQYAASKKVPKPDVAVRVTGSMLLAGGTGILLGVKPKYCCHPWLPGGSIPSHARLLEAGEPRAAHE